MDDKTWTIRYLVVDTRDWWSGKKVLVSPEWLTRVTWDEPKALFCIVTAVDTKSRAQRPRCHRSSMAATLPPAIRLFERAQASSGLSRD